MSLDEQSLLAGGWEGAGLGAGHIQSFYQEISKDMVRRLWMDEIHSHHFETTVETIVRWYFEGSQLIPSGF